jgi:hypothetical protein
MMNSKLTNQSIKISVIAIIFLLGMSTFCLRAIDIAPMTWNATSRSGWINVMSPGVYTTDIVGGVPVGAKGNGTTDDAPAINGVLDWVSNHSGTSALGRHVTVYFPPGTYYIGSTLYINGSAGTQTPCNLVGSGLNTIMQWHGPTGGAMVWADGERGSRYVGFVWDGMNKAGCGFLEFSSTGIYMTGIRHENESFRNFNALGKYGSVVDPEGNTHTAPAPDQTYPNGYLGTGIISGFDVLAQPVGEVTIFNSRFYNCTEGVRNPVDIQNNYVWIIDGCEFDNNGTAVDGGTGGSNLIVLNSHFQGSTVDDIVQDGGFRGQRLTSSGSAQFFSGPIAGAAFQDCWVDSWTNPTGAMQLDGSEGGSVVDCTFTNPPQGATPPIHMIASNPIPMQVIFSNLSAPAFPTGAGLPPGSGLLNELIGSGTFITKFIPSGSLGGNITSASQTFLKSTYPPDGPSIYNILSYGADDFGVTDDGNSDSTAAIQSAINAASAANNGSVVYIPAGNFNMSSVNITGGNYVIEGDGFNSSLYWNGQGSAAMMAVSNPQNITIRNINLILPYGSSETSVKETASGTSNITYDNVMDSTSSGPGLVLSSLPAGSKVYIPVLNSPLTVSDCGAAQIFSLRAFMAGPVNVSGATQPKTGFLGLMVAEGGVDAGRPLVEPNPSIYNFTVTDDQNLLVGPYYSEQGYNGLNLQGGAGATPGHVAIQGLVESPSPASVSINANNYTGRLFYSQQAFFGGYEDPSGSVSPVQITQTGSNPINIVLAENFFDCAVPPAITLGAGANLIETLNWYDYDNPTLQPDNPNPLTGAALATIAQGLDDFRQLGALNLALEYANVNPSGLVAYWKLDEAASPAADSTMSGITGTWKNSPTFSATHSILVPYSDPGCITFNGTNQYVSMGNPAALPSGTHARTICGWAKSASTASGTRVIASFGSATTGEAMYIGMNGASLLAGGYSNDLTVTNFWDTKWHFIALTYDGTTAKLYADGVLKTSAAKSWSLVHGACNIGAQVNTASYWNGNVDDVRVYNYALSATQVSSLMLPQGPVVNVQFTDGNPVYPGSAGPGLNGNAWSSTISPLSYLGTAWTEIDGYSTITETNLPYSDGTPSGIGFTLSATSGQGVFSSTNGQSPLTMFTEEVNGYMGNLALKINGLQNGQAYDIYVPSAFDGYGASLTIGTQTLTTTGNASGSTFVSGVNYVKFTGIQPINNAITISVAPNGNNFAILSGLQIIQEP